MSQHRSPLVSVIVTVYNGQETVCRSIDSALEQTYPEREIIVVDDGSTDSSLELLRRYESRIQLVQKKHDGLSIAVNTGFSAARGEYIAFLDQDDTWIPQKLQLQVEILEKYPSVGLTFGNLEMVDKKGEKLGFTTLSRTDRCSPSWEDLLVGFPVHPSSSMWRKELMTRSGGYDDDFIEVGYQDKDFFLRLREITDFHYLDVCLGYFSFDQAHSQRALSNLLLFATKQWNNSRLHNSANDRLRDEFVYAICTSNLLGEMRALLKLGENKVSSEMLHRLNGFHYSFKDLFGDSYRRVTNFESIDLNRYELNPASTTLLFLYLSRSDLQNAYPEARTSDLHRLIEWGARLARGDCIDNDGQMLLAYGDELERLRKSATLHKLRHLWSQLRQIWSRA